jgi:hypothetical protein
MICKRCGADKIFKALIYDKVEQVLYTQYFDNMGEFIIHLGVRNLKRDAVLIFKEVTRPRISRREV